MGRLMRSPEGHEETPPPDPSLISDPPKEEPPKEEPPKEEPPKEEPPKETPPTPEPLTVEQIAVPEGFELQPELANEFLEVLNGEMEPKERADALIALHAKTINAALEADSKAWDTMQTEWKDAAKADPEVGGDKLQPALNNIGKLLDEFGDKELRDVFGLTGAGNNVHMIKFLSKIADVMTEGKFFKSGSPAQGNDPEAVAQRLFPSMKG